MSKERKFSIEVAERLRWKGMINGGEHCGTSAFLEDPDNPEIAIGSVCYNSNKEWWEIQVGIIDDKGVDHVLLDSNCETKWEGIQTVSKFVRENTVGYCESKDHVETSREALLEAAARAMNNYRDGRTMSDKELESAITVLDELIPFLNKMGDVYRLVVKDWSSILSSFEQFKESRKQVLNEIRK